MKPPRGGNHLLKASIFATGLAGIVAEYVMATLATYLLGDPVKQWTLTISLMLFAMGVGSRFSRKIRGSLLDAFVAVELLLSVLCASCALITYLLAAYLESVALVLYGLAFAIGFLIGLEMPLATRLNDQFEELRINVSSIMEKDYYGALLGGLIFAFFALPQLGLTYTPILLGAVNFAVAAALFVSYRRQIARKISLTAAFAAVPALLAGLVLVAEPITLFGEQGQYKDRIVYQEQSSYQKIVVTQWKEHFWLYLNGSEQFSSYDEERYHEPLVHPAMSLSVSRQRVLILGGGDGLAAREVLKHPDAGSITLVDLDPAVTDLALNHPIFLRLNRDSLSDPRLRIINQDAHSYLRDSSQIFDVILIDLPDPKTVALARLYSREFYQTALKHLSRGGTLVTQATSPFFSKDAFLCILKTMRGAGIPSVALHNHIPTMGEWGWVLGFNAPEVSDAALRQRLSEQTFQGFETRFLNQEAMLHMLHFGKGVLDRLDQVEVNQELNLALYNYYQRGEWDLY